MKSGVGTLFDGDFMFFKKMKKVPVTAEICLICGKNISTNARHFVREDRRKGLSGSWQLKECDHCGVTSMDPMPTDEQLATYYASYSKDEMIDLSERAGTRYPRLRKLFHRISGDVDPRDFVQISSNSRVLDYGCGHAGYLSDFHNRGVAISGADIAGYVVEACLEKGYDVHKVDNFSHIPFDDGEFDIVYLMQVFEHLRDPHEFIMELSRILKSDGVLYLAVPNAASIWRKVFGSNWVSGWFAPFHLVHYDSNTLKALAESCGFDIVDSWSNTPVSWFRLNLKAWIYPKENQLDWRRSWLDNRFVGCILMSVLRIIELPVRERDCLVIKLNKRT